MIVVTHGLTRSSLHIDQNKCFEIWAFDKTIRVYESCIELQGVVNRHSVQNYKNYHYLSIIQIIQIYKTYKFISKCSLAHASIRFMLYSLSYWRNERYVH